MKLRNVEMLMKQKAANKEFDSYAVYVKIGKNEHTFYSDNVDENTYFDIASCGKIFITSPLIFQAIEQFQDGEYEASGESWKKVMEENGNYDLAYIGIGRSLLRQKEYKEAMEYFELKYDDDNYSRAFKQYRKIWVEENIGWMFLVAALVLCGPLAYGKLKKIKHEIDTADIFKQ